MPSKRTVITVAVASLALFTAACGGSNDSGDADEATRTVEVEMVDIAFMPTDIAVTKGETVRFVFTNNGKTDHEAYLGTATEQMDHEKEMSGGKSSGGHDMGSMGGGGDGAAIDVGPGDTVEFTTRFEKSGTFEIGCHEPGHYAGGMKLTVTVT